MRGVWGRHDIPLGFAVPQSGMARVQSYRWGVLGFFYDNGGMRGAGAWRLYGNFWDFLGIFGRVIGAPCDTPWVCGAAVWNSSGEDLPLG